MKNPGQYDRFYRKGCDQKHEGKCIDVIYGVKNEKSEVQALRYKKDTWNEASARSHCKTRGGSFEPASSKDKANPAPMNFTHNSTVADGEPDWANVDKAALPRAAFADQGEEGKKSTWAYPHHWVKNGGNKDDNGVFTSGTMYLHKGGLNAAWTAAQGGRTGQEASQAVKDHLQTHRKALGMEDRASAPARGYSVKAQANEAEVWIYEEIGEGWFGGISANQFAKDIKALGDIKTIHLRLNSPGGNVFDGVAIYNILKQHKARVKVSIDGLAASIASVIAMAGDEVSMAANSMMMIHEAWTMAMGPAAELRAAADMIEKVNGTIISTYLTRATVGEEKISELMRNETWMTAEEAMGYGLADKLTEPVQAAAHFDLSKFKYKNVPKDKTAPGPLERPAASRQKLASMQIAAQKIRAAGTP